VAVNHASGGTAESGQRPPPRAFEGKTGTNKPYEVAGRWYTPMDQPGYDEIGTASWYGQQFHNHYTADGEIFDMRVPSAAHKTLPLPCLVEVTNLANGRRLVVRVNDRGPFVDGRIIDLSREAASELGFMGVGVTQVRVRYVGPAPANPDGARLYQASDTIASAPRPARIKAATSAPGGAAARGGALLGPEIDDTPIQASPSTVDWSAARGAGEDEPPAAARHVARAPAVPPVEREHEAAAVTGIDDLLDQLPLASVQPVFTAPAQASGSLVQAGAFASRANAERAAARMSGQTQIVPFEQSGHVLYKLMTDAGHGGPDFDQP
jgi:rare lipoprotein A